MKKIVGIALLCVSSLAFGLANDMIMQQRNSTDTSTFVRILPPPASGADGVFIFDGTTILPNLIKIGSGLAIVSGELTASGGTPQVNSDWAASSGVSAILNKPTLFSGEYSALSGIPSTFAPSSHTHDATDVVSGTFADARIPALAISKTTGLQSALDAKFTTPAGTTSQYVRGDGTLATYQSPVQFNYAQPTAKTVAVSTTYQAADNTKAAVITISPSCQNSTTVIASSSCTLQLRQSSSSGLTCSNGTIASTWTSTVQLGLVFTQTSGSPFDVKLPIGGYFVLCATSGAFTINAVEQAIN